MPTDLEGDWDEQDQSEVFDEDNQRINDHGEMRTFQDLPEVMDVTQALGDADDDEALIAEELDDDEIIELEADAAEGDEEYSEAYEDDDEALEASDDAELELMGDMDEAPDIDSRDAAVMEADRVDDDDLDELGYS